MEPQDQPTTTLPDTFSDVPEGIRRARAAFLRDFPKLMADRKTRGKYVCYHNDDLVGVARTYRKMVDEVFARKLPDDATLVFEVSLASEHWEQICAVEGEINPD